MVGAHLNTVLRLVVGGSLLLVSVRNDHELDRFLLEKQKHEVFGEKAKDPTCRLFGDFVVIIGKNGRENLCRLRQTIPCPRCKRGK